MPSQGIPVEQLKNITDNTLNKFERASWVDLDLDLTDYAGFALFTSGRFDRTVRGGVKYQFQALVSSISNTVHIGPYSQIALADNNISSYGEIALRHSLTHFMFDRLEEAAQKGGAALVDLIKMKYAAMLNGHMKTMESVIWGCPAENDAYTPLGFPAFVVMYDSTDATPEDGGFLGTFPYGGGAEWTTAPNGLSPSTYTRAGNYAAKYTTATKGDLFQKMSKGADKTNFRAPSAAMLLVANMPKDTFDRAVYAPYTVIEGARAYAESIQSDNKSKDVDFASTGLKFRNRPFEYVPYLDGVTGAPVYMINHNAIPFLKDPDIQGAYGGTREVGPEMPTTLVRAYLWKWTVGGTDRKKCAVFSTTNKQGT